MNIESIGRWLEILGLSGNFRVEAITGGGNNLAARVEVANQALFLKVYRDRSRAEREFAILQFLERHGFAQIPRPVALHRDELWALHQFVPARRPEPSDLQQGVAEAKTFLEGLRELPTVDVPVAVDAFSDYTDHIELVRRRIVRLGAKELWPRLERLEQLTQPEQPSACDFWVSPSDFGFHNALVRHDGSFCFVDFEYAGVDESSKLVCDFFCQPQLPAPLECLDTFVELLSPEARQRLSWMWEVTTLKWACIILKRPEPEARLESLWQRYQQLATRFSQMQPAC